MTLVDIVYCEDYKSTPCRSILPSWPGHLLESGLVLPGRMMKMVYLTLLVFEMSLLVFNDGVIYSWICQKRR